MKTGHLQHQGRRRETATAVNLDHPGRPGARPLWDLDPQAAASDRLNAPGSGAQGPDQGQPGDRPLRDLSRRSDLLPADFTYLAA